MAGLREDRPVGGEWAAAISTGMAGLLRSYTGRGPEGAHTTIGREHVLVLVRDTLTKASARSLRPRTTTWLTSGRSKEARHVR